MRDIGAGGFEGFSRSSRGDTKSGARPLLFRTHSNPAYEGCDSAGKFPAYGVRDSYNRQQRPDLGPILERPAHQVYRI
jgi:hypothetical protein